MVRPGYKQTEVGVIPEDWELFPVSCFGETKRGAASTCINYKQVGGVRLIRINDFFLDNPVFVEPTEEIMKYSIHERDLLFAGTGASAGASYIPKKEWIGLPHSYNAPRIRVCGKHSKKYLFYSLNSDYVLEQQRAWFVGNAHPFLDTKAISSFAIATPPTKTEQEAIAEVLSDADGLIEALEQLIAKKCAIKQGTMQELLTGKKRLPRFEGEWETKKLGEVAEVVMGQSPSSKSYNYKREGLPLIQGNADISDRNTIKRVYTTEITKLGCKGDILMSVRAPVGEIARATFDVCLGRGVCAIRFSNHYLYHALIAKEATWAKLSKGSTFDSVNSTDVKTFEMELPVDEDEQTAIATVLSDMDAEIAALEAKLSKARQVKQGMMQELLTGRIRLVAHSN